MEINCKKCNDTGEYSNYGGIQDCPFCSKGRGMDEITVAVITAGMFKCTKCGVTNIHHMDDIDDRNEPGESGATCDNCGHDMHVKDLDLD